MLSLCDHLSNNQCMCVYVFLCGCMLCILFQEMCDMGCGDGTDTTSLADLSAKESTHECRAVDQKRCTFQRRQWRQRHLYNDGCELTGANFLECPSQHEAKQAAAVRHTFCCHTPAILTQDGSLADIPSI